MAVPAILPPESRIEPSTASGIAPKRLLMENSGFYRPDMPTTGQLEATGQLEQWEYESRFPHLCRVHRPRPSVAREELFPYILAFLKEQACAHDHQALAPTHERQATH